MCSCRGPQASCLNRWHYGLPYVLSVFQLAHGSTFQRSKLCPNPHTGNVSVTAESVTKVKDPKLWSCIFYIKKKNFLYLIPYSQFLSRSYKISTNFTNTSYFQPEIEKMTHIDIFGHRYRGCQKFP